MSLGMIHQEAVALSYLFTTLSADFLAQAVGDLGLKVGHVLEHVLEDNDVAHDAELARLLLALAAEYLALVGGLGPAAAVRVGLFAPLFYLDAERIEDAGFVGAEGGALCPAVFGHETLREADLAGAVGSRLVGVVGGVIVVFGAAEAGRW